MQILLILTSLTLLIFRKVIHIKSIVGLTLTIVVLCYIWFLFGGFRRLDIGHVLLVLLVSVAVELLIVFQILRNVRVDEMREILVRDEHFGGIGILFVALVFVQDFGGGEVLEALLALVLYVRAVVVVQVGEVVAADHAALRLHHRAVVHLLRRLVHRLHVLHERSVLHKLLPALPTLYRPLIVFPASVRKRVNVERVDSLEFERTKTARYSP